MGIRWTEEQLAMVQAQKKEIVAPRALAEPPRGIPEGKELKTAEFTFPFPPSVNNYWQMMAMPAKPPAKARVMVFIGKAGKQFRADVCRACEGQRLGITGRISVTIVLHGRDRRSFDCDNFSKGLLDAMTHAKVWTDDALIDEIIIRRGHIVPGGMVKVSVRETEKAPEPLELKLEESLEKMPF